MLNSLKLVLPRLNLYRLELEKLLYEKHFCIFSNLFWNILPIIFTDVLYISSHAVSFSNKYNIKIALVTVKFSSTNMF